MMLKICQQFCEISMCESAKARHVDCRRHFSLAGRWYIVSTNYLMSWIDTVQLPAAIAPMTEIS